MKESELLTDYDGSLVDLMEEEDEVEVVEIREDTAEEQIMMNSFKYQEVEVVLKGVLTEVKFETVMPDFGDLEEGDIIDMNEAVEKVNNES